MPTGPALATDVEVAAFLQEDVADLDAAAVALGLELASNAVRDELDQRIDYVEDDLEEVIGEGTSSLLLPELPVVDVTSVTIVGDGDEDDEELTLAAGDFRLERGRNGRYGVVRRLAGVWPRRPLNVLYSHGYALAEDPAPTEVPGAIRLVVIRLVVRNLVNPTRIRQEQVGRYGATYDLTDDDRTALGPFYPGSKAGRR